MPVSRSAVLGWIAVHRNPTDVVVYTMGACNEWQELSSSRLDFFVGGAMGYASTIGLGLALARPGCRVIVIDGDGSLLMNLGTLVTVAAHAPANLVHLVLDNGHYEMVGRVPVLRPAGLGFAAVAAASGQQRCHEIHDLSGLEAAAHDVFGTPGPIFCAIQTELSPPEPMKGAEGLLGAPQAAAELRDALTTDPIKAPGR
ncbi:hypothetical protein PSU4_60020 [Pseudonocardia sulfidoxydans NBRC 16205]|uniref:Thiamine pyrophosphate enzyme TPP-binding domain-containing protein n=1 Tax=Pseudonocardia sulfidoxydans NBRC 16205 TaxID=1223511 RepID=A0A511DVC3_9PSEU|nr:thiamine pyrophosphate-dependent enzyme [Pseudonocardia sulfidoxydans]GEL27048.1 hypothetical protein PSU4_60020 [Pseudonocardia sulfidoxydans NBRC 16205]